MARDGNGYASTDAYKAEENRKRPRNRTRGSREKLQATFLDSLQKYWFDNGPDIFDEARQESPLGFAKLVADLVPKIAHVTGRVETSPTDIDRGLSATAAFLRGVDLAAEGTSSGSADSEDARSAQSVLPFTVPDGESRH